MLWDCPRRLMWEGVGNSRCPDGGGVSSRHARGGEGATNEDKKRRWPPLTRTSIRLSRRASAYVILD